MPSVVGLCVYGYLSWLFFSSVTIDFDMFILENIFSSFFYYVSKCVCVYYDCDVMCIFFFFFYASSVVLIFSYTHTNPFLTKQHKIKKKKKEIFQFSLQNNRSQPTICERPFVYSDQTIWMIEREERNPVVNREHKWKFNRLKDFNRIYVCLCRGTKISI